MQLEVDYSSFRLDNALLFCQCTITVTSENYIIAHKLLLYSFINLMVC